MRAGMKVDDEDFHEIDPRSLLVFGEVARTGSLTAAAQVLGWTQPAVSAHVRRLEKSVSVPLAVRRGRGIEITEAGRSLASHAAQVKATLRDASRDLADHARTETGTVRIAAFPSANGSLTSTGIALAAAQHPGLRLQLEELEPPQALQALRDTECDIAVMFDYEPQVYADCERTDLGEDRMRAVLPPDHRLGDRASVHLHDLAGERWVSGCPSCRQHLMRAAGDAGFEPDVWHSTDDYVAVQSLVAQGLGVAVLPELALRGSRHPQISVHDLADHAPRQIFALCRRGAGRIPAIAAVLGVLAESAAMQGGTQLRG